MVDSHKYSLRQEAKFIKEYGAKPVVNSGRGVSKGDSELSTGSLTFTVDNKATNKKSYSVNKKVLGKLQDDALSKSDGQLPLLHVEIDCDTMAKEEFFVIPKWAFDIVLNELGNK